LKNSNSLRIFVVDNEQVIAKTFAVIPRQSGFVVDTFTNPREAWNSAASQAPDLLISDVTMPEMSGIDLAIQLRSHHPECKALLFSGQAANTELLRIAQQQGRDFELLLKPVHPKDLLGAIRMVVPKGGCENSIVHSHSFMPNEACISRFVINWASCITLMIIRALCRSIRILRVLQGAPNEPGPPRR
jgi:CheY-like chemotaxis protein